MIAHGKPRRGTRRHIPTSATDDASPVVVVDEEKSSTGRVNVRRCLARKKNGQQRNVAKLQIPLIALWQKRLRQNSALLENCNGH